jgi:hypothetical protein
LELIKLRIPLDFIRSQVGTLTWREAEFGLDNELLDPAATIDLAAEDLARDDSPEAALALAIASHDEPVRHHVGELARLSRPESDDCIRRKWLFLTLAWLYEHRGTDADGLDWVEKVCADFHYPPSIAGFVRFMPATGPNLGRELNEAHMLERWRQFLAGERERF